MKRCYLILMLMLCMPVVLWGQDSTQVALPQVILQDDSVPQQSIDTEKSQNRLQKIKHGIKQRIDEKLNEPYDTTRDGRYWWRAMKHGKVDFNDSTMGYPKFLLFCYKTYKWGDRAFNSYDTAYVKGTGKNWKLILKSDNWVDSYIGRPFEDVHMIMNSNLVSNVGVSLSFMAVSLGYSVSISNLVHGGKVSNKVDFSFTCARFAADAYYWENQNKMNITYSNKNNGIEDQKLRQSGIIRKAMGVTAYYFFNNRRYAQAAAYCFSKYQKRSAGSWLAGFSIQHADVNIDVEQLDAEGRKYIPTQADAPRILYNDYCLLVGYGHNWVLGPKWLLNLTVTPYIGYRHNILYEPGNKGALSLNLRGRLGVVYNHRQFFVGLQGYADHHRYKSNGTRMVNSFLDFSALAGVRF